MGVHFLYIVIVKGNVFPIRRQVLMLANSHFCGQARPHAVRMITKTNCNGGCNRRSIMSARGSKTESEAGGPETAAKAEELTPGYLS